MSAVERDNRVIAKRVDVQNALYLGGTQVTADAAELNILDGVTATAAEVNLNDGIPASVTFTVGAEGSNAINTTMQLKDANGANVAVRQGLMMYLASDSTGATPATSLPSTSVAIGTNGKFLAIVAKSLGLLVFNASGQADITITETGVATWYLVVVLPDGKLAVSGAITFA